LQDDYGDYQLLITVIIKEITVSPLRRVAEVETEVAGLFKDSLWFASKYPAPRA